jgi:UDP-N-acetylmuramate dehydrogenase
MQIFSNFDLTNYNSYFIKCKCKKAFFPDNEDDIINLYKSGERFTLIGSGHNIIFSKEFYDESFIIFNGNFNNLNIDLDVIQAEAGTMMIEMSECALKHGLSGLEIFYDIPSSLGGAVVMNAGASGEEIKDVLVKVRYLDLSDLTIKEISKDDMNFEYRNSFFQQNTNKIVLKAWLKLVFKDKTLIQDKMTTIKEQRWAKQPKEYPNAGSVFKRPKGYYVGSLIEDLGLKGYTVGGAKISEKHGGFIVNYNNATGQDILGIITNVKEKVFEKFGVNLEIEQRII